MKAERYSLSLSVVALMSAACTTQNETPEQIYSLHYDRPATFFEESLPLGNGQLGALVYGGIADEHISLNDITLWTGEPDLTPWTPDAWKHLAKVRELLDKEDYAAYEAQVYPPYQEAYSEFLKNNGTSDLQSAFADMHAQFDEDGYAGWHFTQLDLDYCENEDIDDFFNAYVNAGIYDEAFVEACRKDAKELRDIQFTLYALYDGDAEATPVVQNGEIIVIQTNDGKYYLFG